MTADNRRDGESASHLEAAVTIITRWMPDGADKVDVLRRVGLQIAVLRRQDAERVCRRCQKAFVLSVTEQEFYRDRGYTAPTHCPSCRIQRRAERIAAGRASMLPEENRA